MQSRDSCKDCDYEKDSEKELKFLAQIEKSKSLMGSKSRMKYWMIKAVLYAILWTCVVQLMALGELWKPRLLKGWPSCFSHQHLSLAVELSSVPHKVVLPPKSESKTFK